MSDLAQMLAEAIQNTKVAEVIRQTESADRISLVCRVHDKKVWCSVLEYVLSRKTNWTEHVCQQYFLTNGRLVYGWNFILNSTTLDSSVKEACRLIKASVGVAKQLGNTGGVTNEMPLVGASPRRTANISFDPRAPGPSNGGPSHKGAYGIGGGGK